jgi:hypothetical protein
MAKNDPYKEELLRKEILHDWYRQVSNLGALDQAITNSLYGINHQDVPSRIPHNKEHRGYVFFTRPQLNLSTGNLRNVRALNPFLTKEPLSVQRFARCTLDPRLARGVYEEPNDSLCEQSTMAKSNVDSADAHRGYRSAPRIHLWLI